MRRDSPARKTPVDEDALVVAIATDPQAMLDAIKETETVFPSAGLTARPTGELYFLVGQLRMDGQTSPTTQSGG